MGRSRAFLRTLRTVCRFDINAVAVFSLRYTEDFVPGVLNLRLAIIISRAGLIIIHAPHFGIDVCGLARDFHFDRFGQRVGCYWGVLG